MIEDRVGELRVRVRTDLPEPDTVRERAEQVTRATLERCAALLEERNPGRIVLIRRLPLRWRVDEAALDETTTIEELAGAAADAIERAALPVRLDMPSPDADAVLFEDEPHLRAAYLVAIARGQQAWFYAAVEETDEPLATLAAPQQRSTAFAVLIRLAEAEMLGEVLAAQSPGTVAVLAAALGFTTPAVAKPSSLSRPDVGPAASAVAASVARWPDATPAARTIGLHVHAAALLGVVPDAPAVAILATSAADILAAGGNAMQPGAAEASPLRRGAGFWDETVADQTPDLSTPVDGGAAGVATRAAGLFYLIDRIQELGLAEALWKACLPEDVVLAVAGAELLGPSFADDPAAALFGGVERVGTCPAVSTEQQAEFATAICTALAEALPRRGLAELPPLTVVLAEHPAGRQLVATAEGSPFAIFAWPASSPSLIDEGLRALLAAWPAGGDITATPALASLDTSGRLRPRSDLAAAAPLLPAAGSASGTALLAMTIGAPCCLVTARAGMPPATAPIFVARHLARAGIVRRTGEAMTVHIALDDIDLALRRAALDRDPGWVPWLRCDLRFVFEERGPGAALPLPGSAS